MARISATHIAACSLLALVLAGAPSSAQVGIGAGVASLGENALAAGVNASRLYTEDSLRYGDIGGVLGAYGNVVFRLPVVWFVRLDADAGYVYFPAQTIRIVDASVQDTSATFDVGASLIPIALGASIYLPAEHFRPYAGAQLTYTFVERTLAFVQGDPSMNRTEITNRWEGKNKVGLAVRGGLELGVGPVALDLGLRYNIAGLFSDGSGDEPMNYLQIGVNVLFGNTTESDDEEAGS